MKHSIMAVKRMSGQNRLHLARILLLALTGTSILEFALVACGRFFANIVQSSVHYWRFAQSFHPVTLWRTEDTMWLLLAAIGLLICVLIISVVTVVAYCMVRWAFVMECHKTRLSESIEANHGRTMLAILLGLRFAWFEYDVAFTKDGKKIGEGTLLSPLECNLPFFRVIHDTGNCVGVHNHPMSENPFSHSDFAVAIERREGQSVVVAGKFVYTLDIPEATWELDSTRVKKAHRQLLHQAEMTGHDGEKLRREYVKACQATAKKYGMTFREERYTAVLLRELCRTVMRK